MDPEKKRLLDKLQANQRRLDDEMQKLKERNVKPQYPPEVILAYRKASEAGEFGRAIRKQTPLTITDDTLELECGHEIVYMVSLLGAHGKPVRIECRHCQKEWLDRASKRIRQQLRWASAAWPEDEEPDPEEDSLERVARKLADDDEEEPLP